MLDEKTLDLVRKLTEEAFGKGMIPNLRTGWAPGCGSVWIENMDTLNEWKCMAHTGIGRKPLPGILGHLQNWNHVGSFLSDDGSVLSVMSGYEDQAKRYAELYEAATGKKVTIVNCVYT